MVFEVCLISVFYAWYIQSWVYFIAAPTLVYRTSYPRNKHIRKRFVFDKSLTAIGATTFGYEVASRYVYPGVFFVFIM